MPVQTLNTDAPAGCTRIAASIAATTSDTKTKSLVCSPSPKYRSVYRAGYDRRRSR